MLTVAESSMPMAQILKNLLYVALFAHYFSSQMRNDHHRQEAGSKNKHTTKGKWDLCFLKVGPRSRYSVISTKFHYLSSHKTQISRKITEGSAIGRVAKNWKTKL